MAGLQSTVAPGVGEEGFLQEPHTLSVVLKCLPREVRSAGSRRQAVAHTCLDASEQFLAIGSEQGYVWILDLHTTKLVRELSDFRGTAITVVVLNTEQEHIAFGTEDGGTKIETFTKQMSRGYRIQEKDRQRVVAMTWDHTGTVLVCAYSSGKLIKAMFQFAGEVMEVVPLLECGSRVVQLSLCGQSLLISTLARSLLLDLDSGRVKQVGTTERKPGSFGGCVSKSSLPDEEGVAPAIIAHLARPGLRMWTADDTGKVTLTTKFRAPLSSGQFPCVPTHNWSSGTPQFSDSWQFSLVLPWLGGLVVTHSDRTLCILDPSSSTVAGVICLEHSITSVTVGGKFVYVLCDGLARPLARFTAHASYLRSLQKTSRTSGATARSEEDLVSAVDEEVGGSQPAVGGREDSSVSIGTGKSEDSESLKEVECDAPREQNVLSPAAIETRESSSADGTEVLVSEEPTIASSDEPANSRSSTATAETPPTPTVQVSEKTQEPQATADSGGSEVADVSLCQDGVPDDVLPESHSTVEEINTATVDSPQNETTPLSSTQESRQEIQETDSHVGGPELHSELDPDTEPPSTTTPSTAELSTGPATRGPGRPHYTDPPSVTGPMGVQDLAREVTDLLRPALGRLSTLMKPVDRRRDGGGSGGAARTSRTASPRESPLGERSLEREVDGEWEREPPVENAGGPSPKLILKLGGKLGELIAGDRDKDQDSPVNSMPSGSQSVGATPTVVGPEEEERRLRMAQAVGEEDAVSERLTQRKRRKRRTKKHSSKPSSTSSSLERLTDIGDGVEGEVATPAVSPQVEPVSDINQVSSSLGEMVGEERSIETRKLSAVIEKEELVSSRRKSEAEVVTSGQSNVETASQTDLKEFATSRLESYRADMLGEEGAQMLTDKPTSTAALLEPISLPNRDQMALPAAPLPSSTTGIRAPEISTDHASHSSRETEGVPQESEKGVKREAYSSSPREDFRSPLSPGACNKSQFVSSVEVTFGNDPLSQLQEDDDNDYFKLFPTSPRKSRAGGRLSEKTDGGSDGSRQVALGEDEVPLELSDNPLYGDDTSDFTTDTESSQQRSRRGSSAKPQGSSRSSSAVPQSSSSAFVAKHMRTKGGPSLGVSQAVSDLSWDSSLQVPRARFDRRFTPSASPFEVSNSPFDLSSSYHSSSSNTLQAPRGKPTAHRLAPQTTSLPSSSNLLHSQEPPGDESGSDFSGDENEGDRVEQQPEHFSLCAAAVDERLPSPAVSAIKSPSPLSPGNSRHLPFDTHHSDRDQEQQEEEAAAAAAARESSPDPDADIWVTVPHPCRGHVQSICLSDHLLWLVDSRNLVYCTEINTKGKKWELIKHQMQQISSSASGSVVWGTYRQNAYVRQGVNELNKLGYVWSNLTKGTSLAQKVKCVCADEEGVWAVKSDGQIIFRKGVSSRTPQGRVWVDVGRAAGFTSVTACSGVVWATNASGRLFYREGVTDQSPSGKKWTEMKAPPLEAVCMTQGSIAWIIDGEGKMGFRGGVSRVQPAGKNPWWEVTVSTTLSHSALPFNSLWQVMTSEGSQFLSSVSSLIHTHLPGHHKLLAVSASDKAGVCVLESGSKLHACWRSTTGYHYSSASKDGVFQLTTWTMFGSGSTGLWVVRDDGELYCVTPQDKFVRIECASTVQVMAVSSTALWVLANDQLWSRQGMTAALPEGISWDYIELSPQLHQRKLKNIVCGKRAVWAVDRTGVPHFRFGVHSREPGTGMSPAWVPVDDLSHPLQQITVSNNDWLVWAVDENCNSYVRTGVTPDFPVGTAWDVVPGQPVKQLCAHGRKVYALTPSGNLLCRYGITETNVQGNYWRQLPGNFVHITVGHGGVLLGLDSKGSILKQLCRTLTVAHDSEFLMHRFESTLDNSWEVV